MISKGYPVDIYGVLPPGLGCLGGSGGLGRSEKSHLWRFMGQRQISFKFSWIVNFIQIISWNRIKFELLINFLCKTSLICRIVKKCLKIFPLNCHRKWLKMFLICSLVAPSLKKSNLLVEWFALLPLTKKSRVLFRLQQGPFHGHLPFFLLY